MIKNNKGFAVTEVLILSTVIIGVLIFMYAQFKNINRSYQYSFKYDTVEGLYLANNILNFINDDNYDKLVNETSNRAEKYIDITNCDIDLFKSSSYCDLLFEKSQVEQIIFTEENLTELKKHSQNITQEFKNYIKQIQTTNEKNDYRIVIKYKNGTFATMRFNKGNSYVEEGLIAHLDGINNTGNGHSKETQIWKDLSNHGNDATLYNSPTWSNNSLTFDGIDDYGILTNTANQAFPNGLTLETRVKILSITDFEGESYNMFIDNATLSSTKGVSQHVMKDLSGFKTRVGVGNASFSTIQNETSCGTDAYYTLLTTYDNNTVKFYVNSELIQTNNLTGTYTSSTNPFNLGKAVPNTAYANVEFQNVLIYDRALTENEIIRNYQADQMRY